MSVIQDKGLGSKSISRLMLRFCIPCIISLLVGALYNIVDQLFIANSPDLGSCGNAASTVVFPLTVVALAIAVVMGDGCCAYVSLLLGSGQNKNASRCMGTAITLTLISSLLLMGIYLHFSQSLLLLFGGGVNEQTLEFSREYFFIIMLGIPFYMFSQAVNPMIRADGSPAVCHDFHPGWRSAQCDSGSAVYLWL